MEGFGLLGIFLGYGRLVAHSDAGCDVAGDLMGVAVVVGVDLDEEGCVVFWGW